MSTSAGAEGDQLGFPWFHRPLTARTEDDGLLRHTKTPQVSNAHLRSVERGKCNHSAAASRSRALASVRLQRPSRPTAVPDHLKRIGQLPRLEPDAAQVAHSLLPRISFEVQR